MALPVWLRDGTRTTLLSLIRSRDDLRTSNVKREPFLPHWVRLAPTALTALHASAYWLSTGNVGEYVFLTDTKPTALILESSKAWMSNPI